MPSQNIAAFRIYCTRAGLQLVLAETSNPSPTWHSKVDLIGQTCNRRQLVVP